MEGDPQVTAEALAAIDERGVFAKEWWVFEGASCPDVFIQTASAIIVIEGKRAEDGPTRRTEWMPVRDQMLRHIDCAWEIRGHRKVYGFFIVEGDENQKSLALPAQWVLAVMETTSSTVLDATLPHRSPDERCQIAEAFLGAVTWQRICLEFAPLGLIFERLPDTCGP